MDMSFEVIQALKAIARQKDVDENLIVETLQAGLASAARKKLGAASNIVVEIDEEAGSLEIFCCKTVADEVEDPQTQMSLEEALAIDPGAQTGGEIRIEIPLSHFGRNAIQAAKQVVIQRIREAERDKVFREYEQRVGEVINGGVQQIDRGNIIVNLGRTEAILPQREQIPREQFRQGSSIRSYIIDVTRSSKGPQVILSRAHRDFLRKLFEMEVPEIKDGTVEIKAVAREPGARSKIAVMSHEDKIDAVGACVGMKGSRVQTVVRELGGERIDVVLWSEEPITFVTRALSPAKVVHADIDPKDGKVTVVVADDQLSLAIGKGGQNARLAAKLTTFKIDLINESQYAERLEFQKLARVPIAEVAGIGQKMRTKLVEAGYNTADDVTRSSVEDLTELEGVGEKTAHKILEAARAKIEEIKEEFMAERAAKAAAAEAEAAAREAAAAAEAAESEADDSIDTEDSETTDEEDETDQITDDASVETPDEAEEAAQAVADDEPEKTDGGSQP